MKIIPVDYLMMCSGVSLYDFELSRLNQAANLRKNLIQIQDELLQTEAEALVARWLIDYRNSLPGARPPFQASFEFHSHLALPPAPAPASPRRATNKKENSINGSKSEKAETRIAS